MKHIVICVMSRLKGNPHPDGRIMCGQIISSQEATRKDFNIISGGFIPYMRVLSNVTLEETKLILFCKITRKIRIIGLNTFLSWVLLMICLLFLQSG